MTQSAGGDDFRNAYDPITLEVIRMRLDNIVDEMGIAMIRSSGSPVITEARDYNTALFDHECRFFSYSDAVQLHIGSGGVAVRNLLKVISLDEMHPGDAFISNDPHTAGSSHPPDTTVISPIFSDADLVGFAQSQAHLVDVGGMTPGGFAPGAYDCFSEALGLPPGVKIFDRGEPIDATRRLLTNNVRMPDLYWNDVRSMVASNNTGTRRLLATVEEFGLAEFRNYTALNFELAEEVLRGRITDIPDGAYSSEDWVEGNGHDDQLHRIVCSMTVAGNSITFDFTGSAPQTDGFINCSYGALVGSIGTAAIALLGWDVPFNEGVMRAFTIIAPEGSIVNPVIPAPVSNGHLTTGVRATRLAVRLLNEACVHSTNETVRRRIQGEWGDSWTGGITAGLRSDTGEFFVWFNMDGGGPGVGAQVTGDGLDAGGCMGSVGNLLPDVEMNEMLYPALYLWRRLATDSCGPGAIRGGMGLDYAWTPWGADLAQVTVFSPSAAVPAWGFAGGYPGGGSGFEIPRETNVRQLLHDDTHPSTAALTAQLVDSQPVNAQNVPLLAGEVLHSWIAGGGGLGDPLSRPVERVAADVRDGYVSPEIARHTYGVAISETLEVDVPATVQERATIRRVRSDGSARVLNDDGLAIDAGHALPVRNSSGIWSCPACAGSLDDGRTWFPAAITATNIAHSRLAEVGVRVRPYDTDNTSVVVDELACPHCGSLLHARIRVVCNGTQDGQSGI